MSELIGTASDIIDFKNEFHKKILAGKKPPTYGDIDINTLPIVGQRGTKLSNVRKHLKDEGGFNWLLYRPISVARWTDPETGEVITRCWDGEHRKEMFKVAFPTATTMPGLIYEVSDAAEANMLFVKIQAKRQTNLNVEELFVNEVLAGDEKAKAVRNSMERMGVCVRLDDAIPPSTTGTTIPATASATAPTTKVRRFKDSLKLTTPAMAGKQLKGVPTKGEEFTQLAVEIIRKAWPASQVILPETLYGFAKLFSLFPALGLQHYLVEFEEWMVQEGSRVGMADFTSDAKRDGAGKHNAEGESIAMGITMAINKDKRVPTLLASLVTPKKTKFLKDYIADV
ncbi:hypothetical protein D3C72_334520 [compost metagenome]